MRDRRVIAGFVLGVLGLIAIGAVEWRVQGQYGELGSSVWRSVDPATGNTVIAFNAKGHGVPNIWCFMDGTRLVRMEFDENGDGVIDRWEYDSPNGRIERAYQLSASGERAMVAVNAREDTP